MSTLSRYQLFEAYISAKKKNLDSDFIALLRTELVKRNITWRLTRSRLLR